MHLHYIQELLVLSYQMAKKILGIINASRWLRENNKYFRPYARYYNRGSTLGPPVIIPTSTLANPYDDSSDIYSNINTIRLTGPQDIVNSGGIFLIQRYTARTFYIIHA